LALVEKTWMVSFVNVYRLTVKGVGSLASDIVLNQLEVTGRLDIDKE
jgi:hypothetical protein